ncbi:hypothetical protein M433DRAFT_139301 [Acidomyces richmondensis BFW]|nr:MAG: hypothetical protein FE78DRAFT_32992 [Acidomyces sp. 'richmondensis']KYG50326.1 hypothetical protein M433DRAFT_139301 [Acidomyces richmondensis BFW]
MRGTAVRHFHPSAFRSDDGIPNHYATLELPTNASPGEIKRQFYKLSKAHHPDLHPDDPDAKQRFVKISEAHATLGSPEKKASYDRYFLRTQGVSSSQVHGGSYSSSSPAGGRPASGLSRRRTQFRGPPPSFYRSGGWGEYSEKRSEHAQKASHSHETQGYAQSGSAGHSGTGPGGFAMGFDNDVRHFNQRGHYRTHSEIEKTRHRARRKNSATDTNEGFEVGEGSSVLFNFFLVSGALTAIVAFSRLFLGLSSFNREGKQRKEYSGE